MFEFEIGYVGLFVTFFLAATILPIASEIFLTSMLALGYNPLICLVISGTGNTFGGWLNYFIGYLGNQKWLLRIGVTIDKIERWRARIHKYGVWLALLSWLPLVGDVIGVALGFFRTNTIVTFTFIAIGKFIRYALIILSYHWIIQ